MASRTLVRVGKWISGVVATVLAGYLTYLVVPKDGQKVPPAIDPAPPFLKDEPAAPPKALADAAEVRAKELASQSKGVMLIVGTLPDGTAQVDVKVRVDNDAIAALPRIVDLSAGNHEVTSGVRSIGAVQVRPGEVTIVTAAFNDLIVHDPR